MWARACAVVCSFLKMDAFCPAVSAPVNGKEHLLTLTVQLPDTTLEQAAKAAAPLGNDLESTDYSEHDIHLSSLLFALGRERMLGYPTGRLFADAVEQAFASVLVHYDGITPHSHPPEAHQ